MNKLLHCARFVHLCIKLPIMRTIMTTHNCIIPLSLEFTQAHTVSLALEKKDTKHFKTKL